jgi:uncharacterized protein (DUF58 family)
MLDPELLARVRALGIKARTIVDGPRVGELASPRKGSSVEFAQHRGYVPGDDIRHIDWRAYARTERYTVKEYQQETNFIAYLLVDASASMGFGAQGATKFDRALLLAGVAATVLALQADAPTVVPLTLGTTREAPAPSSRRDRLERMLENLSAARPSPLQDEETRRPVVATALNDLASRSARRGMVIVISDLLEPLPELMEGFRRLKVRGHDIVVAHVLHGDELELPGDDLVRFDDLESAERLVAQPAVIRDRYRREVKAWLAEFAHGCSGLRVDQFLDRADLAPGDAFPAFLARRRQASRRRG